MLLTTATGGPIASVDVEAMLDDRDSLPAPLLSKYVDTAAWRARSKYDRAQSDAESGEKGSTSPKSSTDSNWSGTAKDRWRSAVSQCRILQQVSWDEHFGDQNSSSQ